MVKLNRGRSIYQKYRYIADIGISVSFPYRHFRYDVVTPRYISISPKRKLRNNIDVIDYFAGDNEIYE